MIDWVKAWISPQKERLQQEFSYVLRQWQTQKGEILNAPSTREKAVRVSILVEMG